MKYNLLDIINAILKAIPVVLLVYDRIKSVIKKKNDR